MPDKQTHLENILKVLQGTITREEFDKAFKLLIEAVRKLQSDSSQSLSEIEDKYQRIVTEVTYSLKTSPIFKEIVQASEDKALGMIADLKKQTLDKVEEEVRSLRADTSVARANLEAKFAKLKSDVQGNLATIASRASKITLERVLPLIPTLEQVEADLPSMGVPIAEALEKLPDENKLVIEAIKDLRKELDDLRKLASQRTLSYGGGGSSSGKVIRLYSLSSQLNGVLKTFTLPAFSRVILVSSTSFPNSAFEPTTDYTTDVNANTITFTSQIDETTILAAGQTLLIQYVEP